MLSRNVFTLGLLNQNAEAVNIHAESTKVAEDAAAKVFTSHFYSVGGGTEKEFILVEEDGREFTKTIEVGERYPRAVLAKQIFKDMDSQVLNLDATLVDSDGKRGEREWTVADKIDSWIPKALDLPPFGSDPVTDLHFAEDRDNILVLIGHQDPNRFNKIVAEHGDKIEKIFVQGRGFNYLCFPPFFNNKVIDPKPAWSDDALWFDAKVAPEWSKAEWDELLEMYPPQLQTLREWNVAGFWFTRQADAMLKRRDGSAYITDAFSSQFGLVSLLNDGSYNQLEINVLKKAAQQGVPGVAGDDGLLTKVESLPFETSLEMSAALPQILAESKAAAKVIDAKIAQLKEAKQSEADMEAAAALSDEIKALEEEKKYVLATVDRTPHNVVVRAYFENITDLYRRWKLDIFDDLSKAEKQRVASVFKSAIEEEIDTMLPRAKTKEYDAATLHQGLRQLAGKNEPLTSQQHLKLMRIVLSGGNIIPDDIEDIEYIKDLQDATKGKNFVFLHDLGLDPMCDDFLAMKLAEFMQNGNVVQELLQSFCAQACNQLRGVCTMIPQSERLHAEVEALHTNFDLALRQEEFTPFPQDSGRVGHRMQVAVPIVLAGLAFAYANMDTLMSFFYGQ